MARKERTSKGRTMTKREMKHSKILVVDDKQGIRGALMVLLVTLLTLYSFTSLAHPTDSFFAYQQDCGQEKLHLTLDRPYYETGDTVWFRGTLVNADNLSYMTKSNYITVELYSKQGDLVLRRKVARSGLHFNHCLPLEQGLPSGEYVLIGYTSWMRNFEPDFFFNRTIRIYNPLDTEVSEDSLQPKELDFSVQFFPEGGTLLAASKVPQQVAFSAVANDGYPIDVDGELLSASGRIIANLASQHDGMGAFIYDAEQQPQQARFSIRGYVDKYGMPYTKTVNLPVPIHDPMAVALQVHDGKGRVLGSRTDSLLLILHSGTRLIEQKKVVANQDFDLDLTQCRTGINHLVVATQDGVGLSRRLLFKNEERSTINPIVCTTQTKEARSLVEMQLHLEDLPGHAAWGDFSVSITDEGYVSGEQFQYEDNITSHLLLTSDLKGYIHQPGWYFADRKAHDAELDLLMLTHGWCRFRTDSLSVLPRLEFPHPLEQCEWLSGEVYNLKKKDLGRNLSISVYDSTGVSFGMGKIDSSGRFFVGDLNYPDQAPLEIRILSWSKKPYYKFDEPTFPDFVSYAPQQAYSRKNISIDMPINDIDLLHGERVKMLDKVEVTDHRRDTADQTGGKILFKGINTAADLAKKYDLNVYNNAYDVMRKSIDEDWWKYKNAREIYRIIQGNGQRLWISDSIGIEDFLVRIPADKVQSISTKVSTGRITLGRGGGLVMDIRIALRDGYEFEFKTIDRRRRTYQTFGYTLPVDFYHPSYEKEEERLDPLPDFRKTLYWNPSVQTDKQGNATIRYYESDHPSTPRRLIIEGVTFPGKVVHIEKVL